MTGAGDGDIGEARIEQVWVDAGITVNEDPFCGKALRTVTGNGISVVEMTMLAALNSIWRLFSRCVEIRPSAWIASMMARSRLAIPKDLWGAVN